jgi:hypothetical protein
MSNLGGLLHVLQAALEEGFIRQDGDCGCTTRDIVRRDHGGIYFDGKHAARG